MAISKIKIIKSLAKIALLVIGIELLLRFISSPPAPPEPYLVPDLTLGYRLRPGWSDSYGAIHINSYGFRGEEKEIAEGALLMMGIGSGDTFGRGVTGNNAAWPNRLETLFRENLPERNVRLINAGVPGRSLLFNMIDLDRRLMEIDPDFVLFMGDIDHLSFHPTSGTSYKPKQWSYLMSGIISRLFPSLHRVQKDHWPGVATELLREHLISLVGICRTRNIRVVLSTIPNTKQIYWLINQGDPSINHVLPHLTPAAVSAAIRSYNETVRRVADKYQVYLVNSAERGSILQTQGPYLGDEGALQVAQGFLNVTRKMGLHKKQQPTTIRRGSIL